MTDLDAGQRRYLAFGEPGGPWVELHEAVKLKWRLAAERDRRQMLRDIQPPRRPRR